MMTVIFIACIAVPAFLLCVTTWKLASTRWGSLIPLRWSPVLLHTIVMLMLIGLYPTGWFIPDIPFDDVYIPYYFIPGLHIYFPTAYALHHLFPWLLEHMGHKAASITAVAIMPGFAGIFLVGIQWLIIRLIMEKVKLPTTACT